jgi:simple sugar transport system ATP-binding protein
MSPAKILENAKSRIGEFDVRTPSGSLAAGTLSGGNQQKVVMARELSRPLRLFIASQPTRGVDVGSIEFLHKRIVAERDQGTPVMIVSTELDEVIELADRIAVLYKGKLVGIVPAGTGRDVLGLMMAGLPPESAAQADTPHTGTAHADTAGAPKPAQTSTSGAEGGDHD